MSNVEHYFENHLFEGHDKIWADTNVEANGQYLSDEVKSAIKECVSYVKYTLMSGWTFRANGSVENECGLTIDELTSAEGYWKNE